jgi:glucokinase
MTIALVSDLGGTNFRAALVEESGAILHRRQVPTPERASTEETVAVLLDLFRTVIDEGGHQPIVAAAATAGLTDGERGVVVASPNIPGFRDVRLAERITEAFGIPALVENDASAAALAEYRFGAGRGARNVLHATLGTGIGGGIIIGGRLYRGSRGFAGEIGHVIIDPAGPLCGCGSHGCIESFVGGVAFTRRARTLISTGRSPHLAQIVGDREPEATDLHEAAVAGDAASETEIRHAGHMLGIGLGSVVTVLDPDRLTLSGGLLAMGDMLLGPMRAAMKEKSYGPSASIDIRLTELDEDPGLLGAAAVAFEALETQRFSEG